MTLDSVSSILFCCLSLAVSGGWPYNPGLDHGCANGFVSPGELALYDAGLKLYYVKLCFTDCEMKSSVQHHYFSYHEFCLAARKKNRSVSW